MQKNAFIKSHGLGNDYIVLNEENIDFKLQPPVIKRICDYHFGIGSDGILLKVKSTKADFGLRIFNPDGSEAEKSGNGLRIFCKYLYDNGFSKSKEFMIETKGGIVRAKILKELDHRARIIQVDMGKAIFDPALIPVNMGGTECIDQPLKAGDRDFRVNCVSVGNPHCVIIKDNLDVNEIMKYGPLIENNQAFPNRINVQFAMPVSRKEVRILIWERGAGYTLASGSSSCAVASIMRKTNRTGDEVTIRMKGGDLQVQIDDEWNIRMTGEAKEIATGYLSRELLID